jgi:hypothetical protein
MPEQVPMSLFWIDMAVLFSDLTPYDKAVLEPSLAYLFDDANCQKKIERLIKNGMSPDDAENIIAESCVTHKKFGETEDYEYWVCPCRLFDAGVGYLVSCAMNLRNGILPFEGGYLDQPANVMSALTIVQNFLNDHEERQRKREQMKAKTRKGG